MSHTNNIVLNRSPIKLDSALGITVTQYHIMVIYYYGTIITDVYLLSVCYTCLFVHLLDGFNSYAGVTNYLNYDSIVVLALLLLL